MMETLDIWFLPCANPDGRNHVQTVDKLWRMNRRPGAACDGVDPNRNCDFMWRVVGPTTVCDPCSSTQGFVGSLPFSEPEANNIHLLCDTHRVDVFCDVHSFSNFVLFPWGHAPTQTTQPLPNFTSLLMGFCRGLEPPSHQEFMPPSDKTKFDTVATRIKNKIAAVHGSNYTLKTIFQVYGGPTTGTSSDYVYSRHIANPALRKTFAFAFETGPDLGQGQILQSFQPNNPDPIKLDTKAGLVELINQSVCAIEFIGTTLQGQSVEAISLARDELLEPTEQGRGWIDLVTNIQGELLEIVLSDRELTKRAMTLLPRVQELADDRQRATVTDADVKDGVEFLEALQSRAKRSEVRDAISTINGELKQAAGQTVHTVLTKLAKYDAPKL